jgi:hypothetical protein
MKTWVIALAFTCISVVAFAESGRWHIGVESMYTYNTLYTEIGYRPFSQYQSGHGFGIGLPVQFTVFDWLAIQSGIQYIQRNYSLIRTNDSDIYTHYTNSFVEFPLSVRVSTHIGVEQLRAYALGGIQMGVWAHQQRSGSFPANVHTGYYDDRDITDISYHKYDEVLPWTETDNRFSASVIGGIGVTYNFGLCSLYVEGQYSYGLTDLHTQYQRQQAPRINDTVTIHTGVLVNIGRTK